MIENEKIDNIKGIVLARKWNVSTLK